MGPSRHDWQEFASPVTTAVCGRRVYCRRVVKTTVFSAAANCSLATPKTGRDCRIGRVTDSPELASASQLRTRPPIPLISNTQVPYSQFERIYPCN